MKAPSGGWKFRLSSLLWHSAQLGRWKCQLYMSAAIYPQGNSLVLISVTGWVDLMAKECGQIERDPWKFPGTTPGTEPRKFHQWKCMCQLQFIPKEIPSYSFLLQAEWTSWLLNAARKNGILENFQGPLRELNPESSISGNASCMCQLQFNPKKIPWYSFLLQAEWTSWLLNAARKNRILENFQVPHRDPNPETSISWCSASTNCATVHPIE